MTGLGFFHRPQGDRRRGEDAVVRPPLSATPLTLAEEQRRHAAHMASPRAESREPTPLLRN